MGSTPTIAECRAAFIEKAQLTRQSARADNAEASQNIEEMLQYKIAATLSPSLSDSGGAIGGKAITYVSFIRPTAGNYPTANIGDRCRVFLLDTSQSETAPYDYEDYVYTANGWGKELVSGTDELFTIDSTLSDQVMATGTITNQTQAIKINIAGTTAYLPVYPTIV